MDDTTHVHTIDCWRTLKEPACYEHHIQELEKLILKTQEELRKVGGALDRIESVVARMLQPPRKDV